MEENKEINLSKEKKKKIIKLPYQSFLEKLQNNININDSQNSININYISIKVLK